MDKSMIKGIAVGGVAMVMLGAGAVTGYRAIATPSHADVVSVKDVAETVLTPHEHCENVLVRHKAAVQDEKRIAGSVVGGIAGGLLGSAIGGGNGKTLATVAGVAAGGYAGNQVQRNLQDRDVTTTSERRCRSVNEKSQRVVAYLVTYRLNGKEGVVRTSFRPGSTLPVKDGQVVTSPPVGVKS